MLERYCSCCGGNLKDLNLANVSPVNGRILCERCATEKIRNNTFAKWIEESEKREDFWWDE